MRPVVHEKQLSGSQMRISIRISDADFNRDLRCGFQSGSQMRISIRISDADFNPDLRCGFQSGSQMRISIRITPNFELGLSMIITSVHLKFHQNPTSSLREIPLTNKQTDKQRIFGHTEVRTLDPRVFSTMLSLTEL